MGKRVMVCWGTRPEEIKLAPVIRELEAVGIEVLPFETVQSPDLLTERGKPGIIWNNLVSGISGTMASLRLHLADGDVDAVVVQGDTATAFACALTAWLERVPVAHVEAGMRTYREEPWPEEQLRQMISRIARWHFAPSDIEVDALINEGVAADRIFLTGNPVIDSMPRQRLKVLVTLHRRENWGERIGNALDVLNTTAERSELPLGVSVVTHPNWNRWLSESFSRWPYLNFAQPMSREHFLMAMAEADVIVTDSGGLQEEAAWFGKPCIVVRTATERKALEEVGAVLLVNPDRPVELRHILDTMVKARSAYGLGKASQRIAQKLRELLHG
jgi:UDP-N-acetylglucosamine 2-epimerase (non-hydrolysing)